MRAHGEITARMELCEQGEKLFLSKKQICIIFVSKNIQKQTCKNVSFATKK